MSSEPTQNEPQKQRIKAEKSVSTYDPESIDDFQSEAGSESAVSSECQRRKASRIMNCFGGSSTSSHSVLSDSMRTSVSGEFLFSTHCVR